MLFIRLFKTLSNIREDNIIYVRHPSRIIHKYGIASSWNVMLNIYRL
jgi:hypothetical protein